MPSEKAGDTDAFVADASVGIRVERALASHSCYRAPAGPPRNRNAVPGAGPLALKRLAPDEFARARLELEGLTPLIDEEGARLVWNDVTELAERFGLTIYDAAYLELAIRRGLPLASRDTSLNDAARLRGVKTLL